MTDQIANQPKIVQRECYYVVSDVLPFEEGGFRPGSKFSGLEIQEMLIHRSVSPGLGIRSWRGEFVVREHRGKLYLERNRA